MLLNQAEIGYLDKDVALVTRTFAIKNIAIEALLQSPCIGALELSRSPSNVPSGMSLVPWYHLSFCGAQFRSQIEFPIANSCLSPVQTNTLIE